MYAAPAAKRIGLELIARCCRHRRQTHAASELSIAGQTGDGGGVAHKSPFVIVEEDLENKEEIRGGPGEKPPMNDEENNHKHLL